MVESEARPAPYTKVRAPAAASGRGKREPRLRLQRCPPTRRAIPSNSGPWSPDPHPHATVRSPERDFLAAALVNIASRFIAPDLAEGYFVLVIPLSTRKLVGKPIRQPFANLGCDSLLKGGPQGVSLFR